MARMPKTGQSALAQSACIKYHDNGSILSKLVSFWFPDCADKTQGGIYICIVKVLILVQFYIYKYNYKTNKKDIIYLNVSYEVLLFQILWHFPVKGTVKYRTVTIDKNTMKNYLKNDVHVV